MALPTKKPAVPEFSTENFSDKHRPQTLEDIVGQDHVVDIVRGMIKRKKVSNAMLLTGATGVGKTTFARIIVSTINDGNLYDVQEVNVGDNRSIDDIRGIASSVQYRPMASRFKAFILDECQALGVNSPATNALLKVLEDIPKYVVFVLCTSEPDKVAPTIKGRCSPMALNEVISVEDLQKLIKRICAAEGVTFGKVHDTVVDAVAKSSGGQPRFCVQVLGNVINLYAANSKVDDVDALVDKAIKSLDIATDKVAIKLLMALYLNAPITTVKCLNETTNYRSLLNLLLMLNFGLINSLVKLNGLNYPQKTFIQHISKKKSDISLKQATAMHRFLSDLKHKMVYGSDEKSLMFGELTQPVVLGRESIN